MKKIFLFFFSIIPLLNFAQNIAITDEDSYSPNNSAMLDVMSTTKGMLVPRVTADQRIAILNPATGLLVFDTDSVSFYFYSGAGWINLTSDNASGIWSKSNEKVFLSDTTSKLGVGTNSPTGKFIVQADNSIGVEDPLFEVKDKDGQTVFAVHNDGIRVYVDETVNGNIGGFAVSGRDVTKNIKDYAWISKDSVRFYLDDSGKGNIGGFAVSGKAVTKGAYDEFFRVTPDSTRIWVKETAKGNIGGFAVSGREVTKGQEHTYLHVTPDSTRVYINDDATKGNIGGFAVSGKAVTKGMETQFLRVTPDSTRVFFNHGSTKGNIGGFAVSGKEVTKGLEEEYFKIDIDTNRIINSERRILWYPTKDAFRTGTVLIEDSDSVGSNSFASGFESKAIGDYSQALGYKAIARGDYSTAIGNSAIANSNNSFAFGDSALATGKGAYAIGSIDRDTLGNTTFTPTLASGDYSFALGLGAQAKNNNAFAIGTNTTAYGNGAFAIGYNSEALYDFTIALGESCVSTGDNSITIGNFNTATTTLGGQFGTKRQSIAIGTDNIAEGDNHYIVGGDGTGTSIAIGNSCYAKSYYQFANFPSFKSIYHTAIAIGREASADGKNVFSIGSETTAEGFCSYAFGRGISVNANYSMAFALDNLTTTNLTQDNTMAIMGGKVGIGTVAPNSELHVNGNVNVNTNIGINTTDFGGGTKVIAIENGVAPTSSCSNGVILYADYVNAELRVRDESGFVTTLSPHNFSISPKSEPMAWSFYSESDEHQKKINVDMLKAIRLIESMSGEKLVYITDFDDKIVEDEIQDKNSLIDKINKQQQEIEQLKTELKELRQLLEQQ